MNKIITVLVIGGVAYSAYHVGKFVGEVSLGIDLVRILIEEFKDSRDYRSYRSYHSYSDYNKNREE